MGDIEKTLETVLSKLTEQKTDIFLDIFPNIDESQAILNNIQPQGFDDQSKPSQSVFYSFHSLNQNGVSNLAGQDHPSTEHQKTEQSSHFRSMGLH